MTATAAPDGETSGPASSGAEDLDALAQTFVERARRGESPSIEAIAAKHPDLADEIRELFPVLALVEGLKVSDADAPGPTPALPERLGDYALGPELGRGGMGTVYEGRRVGGDGPERVAVKIVHPHLLGRPEFVARFLREAAAGRRVDHPNVVRTIETGIADAEDGEIPYIVLEYVEGQDLRALLREVEVVPERLCRLVGARVADALTAVHAAGLVHRDVKPENVVITADETVKLMDLGVAVVQDRLQRLSRTGDFVGSLLYAAPGQVAGERPEPGWDLHALGILLYELATGRHPARSASLRWLRADASARTSMAHRDALLDVSPFLATVLETLLAPDVDDAVESAAALRDVLREGEGGAWWRGRRKVALTPAARLRRLARPTGFHGRREEWATLDRAQATAREDRGQVVLVEGEAGIGKSRLLHEWAAAGAGTDEAPRLVVLTHAPGGGATDEAQLAAALAPFLGEDPEPRLEALLGSRAPQARGLARRLRGEGQRDDGVDYAAAWLALLRGLARERTLVLVAEDLHFAVSEDVERFLYLARGATDTGLLLIGTYRPEAASVALSELALLDHVHPLRLDGLDTDACHRLLLEAAATTPRPSESIRRIAERSDRNPMLLLELARRSSQPSGADATTIPDSIRGLLAARIGALEAEDRELLETAACHGYEFDPLVVAGAAGVGRVHALKRFARMERIHHLLRSAGRHYAFHHHLVQEVLYEDLHPSLREAHHAALGEAFEASGAPHTDGDTVALSRHFLEGGQPLRSKPYLGRALEHLEFDEHAYSASEELARTALQVEGLLEGVDRAFALFLHGRRCISAARFDEADDVLQEAQELARRHEEGVIEVDVLKLLSWLARRRGDLDTAVEHVRHAAERAHELGDASFEAAAWSRLAALRMDAGRLDEAEAFLAKARATLETLETHDEPSARVHVLSNQAGLHIAQGRLAEAEADLREAERLAHAHGDDPSEFMCVQERGRLAFRTGHFEEAARHARAALDLSRHLGATHRDAFLLQNIARCLLKTGRFDAALDHLSEAQEIAAREGDDLMRASIADAHAQVLLGRGSLADALETVEGGCRLAATSGREDLPVQAALTRSDVLVALGRFDEADRVREDAERAWSGRGATSLASGLLIGRARRLETEGRHAEACEPYAGALELAEVHGLLRPPVAFHAARAALRAGRPEAAEAGLREGLAWAREAGVPSILVLAQIHLASLPDGDRLAARVACERYADRLTALERIEAHYVLGTLDGDADALATAKRELKTLLLAARAKDREAMRTRVELYRRVLEAAEAP